MNRLIRYLIRLLMLPLREEIKIMARKMKKMKMMKIKMIKMKIIMKNKI